ncbi:MAG: hypothetical protein ACRDRO_22990, partial [Pseudonocardiaceae bacterium]
ALRTRARGQDRAGCSFGIRTSSIAGERPPAVAGHYALIVLRVRHPSIDRILVTDTPVADLKL